MVAVSMGSRNGHVPRAEGDEPPGATVSVAEVEDSV
jgi:hypothetical protein